MLAKIIKLAGLIPLVACGIADKIFDIDFLKELDLLKGFQGIKPHLIALMAYVIAGIRARNHYKTKPEAENDLSRRRWSTWALALFVLCLLIANVPLPDTAFFETYAIVRWYIAAALYVFFYLCLGAATPDTPKPDTPSTKK
jgi:hypothetical protein